MKLIKLYHCHISNIKFRIIVDKDLDENIMKAVYHFPCHPPIAAEVRRDKDRGSIHIFGDELVDNKMKEQIDKIGWNRYETTFPITMSRDDIVSALCMLLVY